MDHRGLRHDSPGPAARRAERPCRSTGSPSRTAATPRARVTVRRSPTRARPSSRGSSTSTSPLGVRARHVPDRWNLDGDVIESFSPDFYLPDIELYVELTTLKQSARPQEEPQAAPPARALPGHPDQAVLRPRLPDAAAQVRAAGAASTTLTGTHRPGDAAAVPAVIVARGGAGQVARDRRAAAVDAGPSTRVRAGAGTPPGSRGQAAGRRRRRPASRRRRRRDTATACIARGRRSAGDRCRRDSHDLTGGTADPPMTRTVDLMPTSARSC